MRSVALTVLVLAACSPTLEVPDGVILTCGSNNDCRDGLTCREAKCAVADDIAPHVLGAHASAYDSLIVSFDEPMDETSARDFASYVFSPALALRDAAVSIDGTNVTLQATAGLGHALTYTVSVIGARDQSGNFVAADARTTGFASYFGAPSGGIPSPVDPLGSTLVTHLTAQLSWVAVADAESYRVQVAAEANTDFSVLAIPEVTVGPVSKTTIHVPSAGAYIWRVTSDVSNGVFDTTRTGRFEAIDDTVYVCSSPLCSTTSLHLGSRELPMATIQAGIALAERIGVANIAIADDGSGYFGENVVSHDVSLHGGYDDTTFTEDHRTHRSLIRGYDSIVRVERASQVAIDGLEIQEGANATSPVGIEVVGCSGDVAITNTVVITTGTNGVAGGVKLATTAPGCVFNLTDSEIEARGSLAFGVTSTGAAVTMARTAVTTESFGSGANATGITLVLGSLPADLSAMEVSVTPDPANADTFAVRASGTSTAITLRDSVVVATSDVVYGAFTLIDRSRIEVAGSAFNRHAVILSGNPTPSIVRNSILIGVGEAVIGATYLTGNTLFGSPTVRPGVVTTNNIFVSATNACVFFNLQNDLDAVRSFENNAFLDCSTLLASGPVPTVTSLGAVVALFPTRARSGGNITGSSTGMFDADHRLVSAPANVKSGAKQPDATTCGLTDAPEACNGTLEDLDGTPRTAPFTIGAEELD